MGCFVLLFGGFLSFLHLVLDDVQRVLLVGLFFLLSHLLLQIGLDLFFAQNDGLVHLNFLLFILLFFFLNLGSYLLFLLFFLFFFILSIFLFGLETHFFKDGIEILGFLLNIQGFFLFLILLLSLFFLLNLRFLDLFFLIFFLVLLHQIKHIFFVFRIGVTLFHPSLLFFLLFLLLLLEDL